MKKAYLNWSSGKDAALALYKIQKEADIKVDCLLTSVSSEFNRVSMHGLRSSLLEKQAIAIGIPLQKVVLEGTVSMEEYSAIMKRTTQELVNKGYTESVFGDIFLEDLKEYRDKELAKVGLKGVYPLWKKDTTSLLKELIGAGFKAITVCVNAKLLDASFCGREIDANFFEDLPANVDPCGENGEFHTFVYDGPIFKNPVLFKKGELVKKDYTPTKKGTDCYKDQQSWDTSFWYCDLLPM